MSRVFRGTALRSGVNHHTPAIQFADILAGPIGDAEPPGPATGCPPGSRARRSSPACTSSRRCRRNPRSDRGERPLCRPGTAQADPQVADVRVGYIHGHLHAADAGSGGREGPRSIPAGTLSGICVPGASSSTTLPCGGPVVVNSSAQLLSMPTRPRPGPERSDAATGLYAAAAERGQGRQVRLPDRALDVVGGPALVPRVQHHGRAPRGQRA